MDEIANNLRSLKMPGMANFWTSLHETRQHDDLSLKDGLLMMIQAEFTSAIRHPSTRSSLTPRVA